MHHFQDSETITSLTIICIIFGIVNILFNLTSLSISPIRFDTIKFYVEIKCNSSNDIKQIKERKGLKKNILIAFASKLRVGTQQIEVIGATETDDGIILTFMYNKIQTFEDKDLLRKESTNSLKESLLSGIGSDIDQMSELIDFSDEIFQQLIQHIQLLIHTIIIHK